MTSDGAVGGISQQCWALYGAAILRDGAACVEAAARWRVGGGGRVALQDGSFGRAGGVWLRGGGDQGGGVGVGGVVQHRVGGAQFDDAA